MAIFNVSELEAMMPEPEEVRTAAKALLDGATAIDTITEAAAHSWGKLQSPEVYAIDGAEVVFSAYRPIKTASEDLAGDFGTLDRAANTYADEVVALKAWLAAAKADAAAFNRKTAGDDDWNKDQDLYDEQLAITGELNSIAADLSTAERNFANALTAIYGGDKYVETSEEGPGAGEVEYGFSRDSLNTASMEGNVPWAHPREYDKPWYQDVGDAIGSFAKGVWSGVTGTITGLGNMVGLGGPEAFAQTWKGLGKLAMDVAIVAVPGVSMALVATGNGQKVKDAADELLAVGKAAIHWDEWKSDPAYAAGASTFDLASILLTAGAGATAKVGSVASKVSDVAATGSKVGKVMDFSGLGKAADVTIKVTDFAEKLKIDTSRIAAQAGREAFEAGKTALGRVGSSGPHMDDAAAAAAKPAGRVPVQGMEDAAAGSGTRTFPDQQASASGGSARPAPYVPDSPDRAPGGTNLANDGGGTGTRTPVGTSGPGNAEPSAARGPAPLADRDDAGQSRSAQAEPAPAPKADPDGGAAHGAAPETAALTNPGTGRDADDTGASSKGDNPKTLPDDGTSAPGQTAPGHSDVETPERSSVPDDDGGRPTAGDPDGPDSTDASGPMHGNGPDGTASGDGTGDGGSSPADDAGVPSSGGGAPDGPDVPSAQERVADAIPEVKQRIEIDDFDKARTPWVKEGDVLDPNTRYDVAGRGTFYTDENGRVAVVTTNSLADGIHPDLNRPLPNVVYQVNDVVMYRTDSNANTVYAFIDDYRERDGVRSESIQTSVGRAGFEEMYPGKSATDIPARYHYDGGHLIGTQSGGVRERINLQAMLRQVNQSMGGKNSFYRLEQQLIELSRQSPPVRVALEIQSVFESGAKTPSSFIVRHAEDGVMRRQQEFVNFVDRYGTGD